MICGWKSGQQCLKIFKAIHQTNKMVNITFDSLGMHIMCMDMSKTSLVKMQLEACEFEHYQCEKSMTLGLYTEVLVNILQKVKKNKLVWTAQNDAEFSIAFVENAQKTKFTVRTLDIEDDQLDVPELQDDMALRVPREVLQDWLDKMLMTKNDVQIKATQEQIVCESASIDMGTICCSEPVGTDRVVAVAQRRDVDVLFSFYATKMLAVFSGTGGDTCFIGLSNEQPSRIKISLGDNSYLCLFIAPKMTD